MWSAGYEATGLLYPATIKSAFLVEDREFFLSDSGGHVLRMCALRCNSVGPAFKRPLHLANRTPRRVSLPQFC